VRKLFFLFFALITLYAQDDFTDEYEDVKVESFDPLSGYNRFMTDINDKLYVSVFTPIARGYGEAVPEKGRIAIANFFDNLMFPLRFVNNVLQLKFLNALDESGRFGINTTAGLFGFFDTAKERYGLYGHDEDFGQTLGHYGVGGGFHIVLPIIGPSNLRDMVGMVGDSCTDPFTYTIEGWENSGIKFYKQMNHLSLHLGEYENLKKDAIDLYPFLREIYEKRREKLIKE